MVDPPTAFVSLSRNARTALRDASDRRNPSRDGPPPPPIPGGAGDLTGRALTDRAAAPAPPRAAVPAAATAAPTRTLLPAAAVLLAGPTVLAFFSGGYGVESQLLAASVTLVVLGVLAATAPWPLVRSPIALVALGALIGLAVWTGLSVDWSRIRNLAADETAQMGLYASFFAAALIVIQERSVRRAAPIVLLAGAVTVALYALAGRLLPDLFPVTLSGRAGSRIEQPLTYWNALGLLMSFGMLLAAALAANERLTARARALACTAAVPCAVVLYLTFSRGSLVALAAGFVALFLMRPRRALLVAAAVVLAGAAVLALVLQLLPDVLELGGGDSGAQTGQGAIFVAALAAVTVAVGAAFARFARAGRDDGALGLSPGLRRVLAIGTMAAVIGVAWLIATGSEKTDPLPSSKERLTKISTNRGEYWRVAVDSFAGDPLTGVGAGSYGVEWRRERESEDFAQDAHTLYLETLAELGLVGGLLLATFLGAVLLGVARSGSDATDPIAPAAAACLAAFLVHVGLDWTWEFPAVTLIALLFAAAAVQPARARARSGT